MRSRLNSFTPVRLLAAVTTLAATLTADPAWAASATWQGTSDAAWANTNNWNPLAVTVPGTGETATFDNALGATTIDLGGGVTLSNLLFDSASAAAYTIGSGAVGSQTLSLDNAGAVTLNSGVVSDQVLAANLSLSSAAGATAVIANSSSALLTIAGGVAANAATGNGVLTISGLGNTTILGPITKATATTGTNALLKAGAGTLTLSSNSVWSGSGAIGRIPATSAGFPLVAREGTLLLNKGGTHTVNGELVIGGVVADGGAGQNAKIVVDRSTLNVSSWFSVGRGNGVGGVSSDLVLTNAAVVSVGNLSAGQNGGNAANLPKGSITLNDSSSFTVSGNGAWHLAESSGSDITMTMSGSSTFTAAGTGEKNIGRNGTGRLTLTNSSSMILGNQTTYIGREFGTGIVTVANSGKLNMAGELRLAGSSVNGAGRNPRGLLTVDGGTVNIQTLTLGRGNDVLNKPSGELIVANGGVVTCTNDAVVGYAGAAGSYGKITVNNGGTFRIAPVTTKWLSMGWWDYVDGIIEVNNGGDFKLLYGSSIKFVRGASNLAHTNRIDLNGGALTCYVDGGTNVDGATGNIDLQYNTGSYPLINNVVNLNGGVLTIGNIISSGTSSTRIINFNGGTLRAAATDGRALITVSGATARVNVRDGGAIIDSNGKNTSIAPQLVVSDIAGDAGTGGLTKIGNGTLVLSGGSTYNGPTTLLGGTLSLDASLTTPSVSAGDLTVSNATLTLALNSGGSSLPAANVALKGSTVLNLNFGTIPGTPATAINATGSLVQSGTTTINIAGIGFAGGMVVPLITTTAAVSTNNFALGPLPPGVFGVLTNNTDNSLDLLVTAAVQLLTWYGSDSAGTISLSNWDISTSSNWNYGTAQYLQYGGDTYGDIVTFSDALSGSPVLANNVNLPVRVVPSLLMVNSAQAYSFTGPGGIDGATSLLVTNTGSLFLGTSNGYTGGTIVGGGTLTITDNSALGATTGAVALTGGNLQLGADLASSRSLALNANATIGVSPGATAQWGGVISGTGQLSKTDTGTLTLTATNTSTGQVWVRAGELIVDSNGSYTNNTWDDVGFGSGDNATMTLKGNGSFSTGYDFNIADIDNAVGVLNIQDGAKLTANSLFVASGNNTASTAQGTVNQTGGTVTQLSTGVGAFAIGGRRDTVNDPGSVGIYNLSSGTLIANAGIRVGGNGDGTLNLSGGYLLAKQGINLARISGATGTCNLDGGTLETFNVASSTRTNAIFNFNGGTLKAYTNNATFFTGLTRANVRDNGGVIDTAGFDVTIAQPLMVSDIAGDAGTGGLTKTGNGTLTLTGTNTYVGATAVSQGTLALTPAQQVTSMPLTLAGGTKLAISAIGNGVVKVGDLTAGAVSSDLTTMGFGLVTGTNPLSAVLECGTLTLDGTNTVSLSGLLNPGTFPLIKYTGALAGSGYLNPNVAVPHGYSATLSNAPAVSTIYVTVSGSGGIVWQGYNPNPALTNLWDKNSTTNWLSGLTPSEYAEVTPPGDKVVFDDTGSGLVLLSNTVSPASMLITNNATSYTFQGSGHISGITGVTKNGAGGATMAYAGNDYSGATVINNGTLTLTSGSAIGDLSAVTLSNAAGASLVVSADETIGSLAGGGSTGGNVSFNAQLTVGANNSSTTYGGAATGTGRLIVNGTGSLTVTGLVAAGNELWVGGVASANTPTLNIQSGTTVTSTGWLVVGRDGSTGTINVNGGTMVHDGAGNLTLGTLGTNPKGILNLNSGSISNLTGETWLSEGNTLGAVGIYNQSGGYAYLGNFHVGHYASATGSGYGEATITGGTVDAGHIEIGRGYNNTREGTNVMTIGAGVMVNASSYVRLAFAGGANLWGMLTNNGGILNVGSTALYLGYWDPCNADLTLNSGQINLWSNSEIRFGAENNSGVCSFHQNNGTVTFYSDGGTNVGGTGSLNIGNAGSGTYTYNLNGGTLTVPQIRKAGGGGSGTFYFNGGTVKAAASSTTFMNGLTAAYVMAPGAKIDTAAHSIDIAQDLLDGDGGGGGLTKTGAGTLNLNGNNSYAGTTTVSNGTLGGSGTIAGSVTVNGGASLAPGASIGTLTINGDLTLNAGSTNVFEVDGTTPANDLVIAGASVNYGGVLRVVPSGTFTAGQTFTLFSGPGVVNPDNFASVQSSSPGLVFAFTNGVLTVVSSIASNPTNITYSISGNQLTLTWPADHLGWLLQVQTNGLNVGLSNNWQDVPGSGSSTQAVITIDPADPSVFYRLRLP